MTRTAKNAWPPLVIPASCFVAGVLVTLLWTSVFSNGSQIEAPTPPGSDHNASETFHAVAEALTTTDQTLLGNITANAAGLSRNDLLLAIPSSLARLALSIAVVCHCLVLHYYIYRAQSAQMMKIVGNERLKCLH